MRRIAAGLVLVPAAMGVRVFAAQSIQGAVAVSSADAATYLGTTNGVGCRYYSVAGSETGVNLNTGGACFNARCLRNYNAARSLYVCNGENTATYNADGDGQVFYNIIDSQVGEGACNHESFYAFQGMITHSLTILDPGDFRTAGCPGTTSVNCLEVVDAAKARQTPLLYVNAGTSGPHEITSIGGLSPTPNVRLYYSVANGCPLGQVRLTWDEPENYNGCMKDGVPSPLQGVRLWKLSSPCSVCPTGDVATEGWTPVAFFATGSGQFGTCQTVSGDAWYALTVVAKGGGSGPSQIDVGIVGTPGAGGTGFVGTNSQCVTFQPTAIRITGVTARYVGRGTVAVSLQTGSEAGVSSFAVQRASSPSGPWTSIGAPIAPRGDGSTYTVTDNVRASLGHVLYYAVEVTMNDGSTSTTGSSAVTLPAIKKKISPGDN